MRLGKRRAVFQNANYGAARGTEFWREPGVAKIQRFAHPALPSESECVSRGPNGARRLAGLRTCRQPSHSGFPVLSPPWLAAIATSADYGVFVPAYRCGAVPDVRRIPFSGERTALTTRSKIDYIVRGAAGQRLYVVVYVEMLLDCDVGLWVDKNGFRTSDLRFISSSVFWRYRVRGRLALCSRDLTSTGWTLAGNRNRRGSDSPLFALLAQPSR